jgi:adenylosuccinate synthase
MNTVVIGANYGDEGKGLITDFETRRTGATVVARFNGGSQAGHTVVDGERRHVFGHIGSGYFAGANTYLSSAFLVNPLTLRQEASQLSTVHAISPDIIVHPNARVSTIYDMAINSLAELNRENRHGSCGLGINETVTRSEQFFAIRASDLFNEDTSELEERMHLIFSKWVPQRLKDLDIDLERMSSIKEAQPALSVLAEHSEGRAIIMSHYAQMYMRLLGDKFAFDPVVFEGAQGLALDENLGAFPHVTRSITGLPSAVLAASELNRQVISPVYVTRCYLTRHGAGPMPHEGEPFTTDGSNPHDPTNVHNEWQGTLRYAPLNLQQLKYLIDEDLERGRVVAKICGNVQITAPSIAVTCLDQVGEFVTVIDLEDQPRVIKTSEVAQFIADAVMLRLSHTSRGPSAGDVTFY